jgi:glutamate-1-semialdehyde aminotransferase
MGAEVWDIDGNRYVDMICGLGSLIYGQSPAFVTKAIARRLELGYPVGMQVEETEHLARAITTLTGMERVTFTVTGSEAVMLAVRLARAATGRERVLVFRGSYHGWYDWACGRDTAGGIEPSGGGILASAVQGVEIADYLDEAVLQTVSTSGEDIAAVVVEPIQASRIGSEPREFLSELRTATARTGTLLVFDEMITGFRLGIGGAQETFQVRADLAAYGKVIGGGLPMGAVAGRGDVIGRLDGGVWRGHRGEAPGVHDVPSAGTYAAHPLAMVAGLAVAKRLTDQGTGDLRRLDQLTEQVAEEFRTIVAKAGAPLAIHQAASMVQCVSDSEWFDTLLAYELKLRGVLVRPSAVWFLSAAHDERCVATVARAFSDAVQATLART